MKYGNVPGLKTPVSRLIIGSMVCSVDDMSTTRDLMDAWLEAGGNCIDTAYVYSGGKSEPALGRWMQERGNRARVVILDKGAHPKGAGPRVNPTGIAEDITESLARLQTDYIDIYLLHRDDLTTPVGPIVESLNEHRAAGRIRVFGGSNWTTLRIQEANDYAASHGLQGFAASSPYFGLAVQNEAAWGGCLSLTAEDYEWHQRTGLSLFPWSSQASGFFTGRYSPDDLDQGDVRRIYYNEGNWERLRRASNLAEVKGCTANNIALAWVLCQPLNVFPLFGPRTVDELRSSLRALDVGLTPEELAWLNLERQAQP